MSDWTLFSNHGHVLVCLARDPQARLRDVAASVGITERAVQKIVRDLQQGDMLSISKQGRRNQYQIHRRVGLRHALESENSVGGLIDFVIGKAKPAPATKRAVSVKPAVAKSVDKADATTGAGSRKSPQAQPGNFPATDRPAAKTLAVEALTAERPAVEKGALEKAAAEKATAEKATAEKATAEKVAAEKLAAERLAAEQAALERAKRERLAAEQAAIERAERERLAAEQAAIEKLVLEKAAAEKLTAEKLAAEKLAAKKKDSEKAKDQEKNEIEKQQGSLF